jgi:thiol-disulfide isomerase/thioredoxin
MKLNQLFAGAVMTLALLASCQQNSYRIEGSGEALTDGDTLFLTTDLTMLTPSDTIVVKDGKFSITGETDSTYFCLLYSARENALAMPFFVEPGTIRIDLPKDMEKARVSGTLCNQEWQIVSDTMAVMSKKMNQLAMQAYGGQLNMEQQANLEDEAERLNDQFRQFIYKTGKRNINNEFGYFIVTFYSDGLLKPDQCKELIQLMPDALRQRTPIKKMEQALGVLQSTAAGETIKDFRMAGLDGNDISLLDEVKKNQLTLLDFWASWCGPCRRAMPQVVTIYQKFHDKGFGIIGISLDEDKDSWAKAVQELGITWTQMSDLKGWDNAIAKAFNIRAIPHMMLVDQEGRIVKDAISPEELELLLTEKLK